MAKKSKVTNEPIDLCISFYDEYTPKQLIDKINTAVASLPKGAENILIEFDRDYDHCYYEGDQASLSVKMKYTLPKVK